MSAHSHVAVVLIFAHKEQLEWHEQISLAQCYRILQSHPIRLICPEGLDLSSYRAIAPQLIVDFIPSHWMESLRAYNRLKILPWLYNRYSDFDYILTYELDAFVFRDELLEWCAKGFDYIGAPWFEGYHLATPDSRPSGVGNSGFSSRSTSSMLRVSRSLRYQIPISEVLQIRARGGMKLKKALADMTIQNNFFSLFNDFTGQEDRYWGDLVRTRFLWFRVASYEEARNFSFELNPRRLFKECGNALPFGCHKWMVFEPTFWRDPIRNYGYEVPTF